jgi:ribonuclease BN (tRNA processing enzyme)
MEVLFPGSTRVTRRFATEFMELGEGAASPVGPARVTAFGVEHASGAPAYALRVEYGGKVIAYSGDTEPTAPLEKLVDGADVAIVEATGPGDIFSHMSWEAAARLRKSHPHTRFFFNHLYSGTVNGAVKDLQVVEV